MIDRWLNSKLAVLTALVTLAALIFSIGLAVGSDRTQLNTVRDDIKKVADRQDKLENELKDALREFNQNARQLTEAVSRLEGKLEK